MADAAYRISILTPHGSGLRYVPDGLLLVEDGRISYAGKFSRARVRRGRPVKDMRGRLAIPGLVDIHCHLPQYPAAAVGEDQLLPWLKKHIFPLEIRFRGSRARALSARFFRDLASHGTTTACVYTSVFAESAETAFEEARLSGLRVVMGKVMMDRQSYHKGFPKNRSRAEASLRQSEALCRKWHGQAAGRLSYAFTPRFALSCSEALMREAGNLAGRYGAYVQTHLAENQDEVAAVRRAFPKARDYTDVYSRAGLLGRKTILAHAVWLKASERRAIKRAGAAIAHCPTSNAFLASGIMDLGSLEGIGMGLGSDVAAGPSLCMFEVMRQAVFAQRFAKAHSLFKKDAGFGPEQAFAMATIGGAKALGFEGRIGSLARGKDADFVVLDPREYDSGGGAAKDAHTAAARLVFRGSRAAVKAAFVQGRRVTGR